MYKKILVPVDMAHLAESDAIIDIAKKHAAEDSRIVLLHVIENIPNYAAIELPADFREKAIADVEKELQGLAERSGIDAEIDVRYGHSYNTILEVSESIGADLIIITSHRPGLRDYFIGSTASRVVRHAPCSVLVVR